VRFLPWLELRFTAVVMQACGAFHAFVPCLVSGLESCGHHARVSVCSLYAATGEAGFESIGLADFQQHGFAVHRPDTSTNAQRHFIGLEVGVQPAQHE
jgi:hypothetical protein